ncbi:MAG: hypothetical protein JWM68_363, partial [Verrucomicrobiales bacterium]|nr:hypothetical protein [Verrucomicrobiales bacterium]
MSLRGGFVGTETDPSQRPASGYPTILSGDIGTAQRAGNQVAVTDVVAGTENIVFDQTDPGFVDNSANVMVLRGVTNVLLDSLVITGGNANNTNGGVKIYETAKIQSMIIPGDVGTIE